MKASGLPHPVTVLGHGKLLPKHGSIEGQGVCSRGRRQKQDEAYPFHGGGILPRALGYLRVIGSLAFAGGVAQLVEQRTFNPTVAGSIPAAPTIAFSLLLALCAGAARGDETKKTASEWIAVLRDGDLAARRKAVYALWKLGPMPESGEAAVADARRDGDEYVRDTAQRLLARQAKTSSLSAALPGMLAALRDDRAPVRLNAAPLFYLPDPFPPEIARRLAGILGEDEPLSAALMGPLSTQAEKSAEVAGVLREALGGAGSAKAWIAMALWTTDMEAATRHLVAALDRGTPFVRAQAALAVTETLPKPAEVEAALVRRLRDTDFDARLAALRALANLRCPGAVIPDAALVLAADEPAAVRAAAAYCLGKVRDRRDEAGGPLLAAIGGADPQVRYAVVLALGWLDEHAAEAAPALAAIAAKPAEGSDLRQAAAVSLGRIQVWSDAVRDALFAMLADDDACVRRPAADRAPRLSSDAPRTLDAPGPVVAALRAVVAARPDGHDASSICDALGRFGPAAAPAEDVLRVQFEKEGYVRTAAAFALCSIHRDAAEPHPALAVLVEALAGDDRFRVTQFLRHLGPAAAPAVPALMRALEDAHAGAGAIQALGAVGPAAKGAVPALRRIAGGDGDPRVKELAAEALGKIEPR